MSDERSQRDRVGKRSRRHAVDEMDSDQRVESGSGSGIAVPPPDGTVMQTSTHSTGSGQRKISREEKHQRRVSKSDANIMSDVMHTSSQSTGALDRRRKTSGIETGVQERER